MRKNSGHGRLRWYYVRLRTYFVLVRSNADVVQCANIFVYHSLRCRQGRAAPDEGIRAAKLPQFRVAGMLHVYTCKQ
jgi:hypothetical protein